MARGRKKTAKEQVKEVIEPVEEQVSEITKSQEEEYHEAVEEMRETDTDIPPAEETVKEEIKEEVRQEPPKNLNEYVQQQLAKQEKAREEAKNIKAVHNVDEKGTLSISVTNMPKPQIKKGKMLRNALITNSITGWQRTLLQGTEVEIVSENGNRTTIRAFGMLHTIASQYVQKL